MRRRDFLRAALAGTVGAWLGGLPEQLGGPVVTRAGSRIRTVIDDDTWPKVRGSRWTSRSTAITLESADGQSFSVQLGPGAISFDGEPWREVRPGVYRPEAELLARRAKA